MKKFFSIFVAAVLLLSLAACGGSSTEGQPEAKPEAQESQSPEAQSPEAEPVKTPKDIAEENFNLIDVTVTLAASSHNAMLQYIDGLGKEYTVDNVLDYCKTEKSKGYDYLETVSAVPDSDEIFAYKDSAVAFVENVLAGWLYLRDYLKDGDREKFSNLQTGIDFYSYFAETYKTESVKYLINAGFSEEEAAKMVSVRALQ